MILPWWNRPRLQILLVCRANVCRSPMAEALLLHRLKQAGTEREIRVASAGVAARRGDPVDPRVEQVLAEAGIPLRKRRARPVRRKDFEKHNLLLAVDEEVREQLLGLAPDPLAHRVHHLCNWLPPPERGDIPDPYFGNLEGFRRVLQLLDTALDAFLEKNLPAQP